MVLMRFRVWNMLQSLDVEPDNGLLLFFGQAFRIEKLVHHLVHQTVAVVGLVGGMKIGRSVRCRFVDLALHHRQKDAGVSHQVQVLFKVKHAISVVIVRVDNRLNVVEIGFQADVVERSGKLTGGDRVCAIVIEQQESIPESLYMIVTELLGNLVELVFLYNIRFLCAVVEPHFRVQTLTRLHHWSAFYVDTVTLALRSLTSLLSRNCFTLRWRHRTLSHRALCIHWYLNRSIFRNIPWIVSIWDRFGIEFSLTRDMYVHRHDTYTGRKLLDTYVTQERLALRFRLVHSFSRWTANRFFWFREIVHTIYKSTAHCISFTLSINSHLDRHLR